MFSASFLQSGNSGLVFSMGSQLRDPSSVTYLTAAICWTRVGRIRADSTYIVAYHDDPVKVE